MCTEKGDKIAVKNTLFLSSFSKLDAVTEVDLPA
jgi:hypothetical protein